MYSANNGLVGLKIEAEDGPIGKVSDVYFDDHRWTIRYLVVDTGTWSTARSALLSPYSFGKPDLKAKSLPVHLTRRQIREAPTQESDQPLSAQYERALMDYYGYPYYWVGPYVWGGFLYPAPPSPNRVDGTSPDMLDKMADDADLEGEGNAHLRSVQEVKGYHVHALDGHIGHIEDFLIDEKDWSIRFLGLSTANWMPGRKVVLPPKLLRDISWLDRSVSVKRTQAEIKNAPGYEDDSFMIPGFADAVDRFYGPVNPKSEADGGRWDAWPEPRSGF
ncbi:MAG: PRC-barrel domain-containing protein [Fibrobacteria bacterium]